MMSRSKTLLLTAALTIAAGQAVAERLKLPDGMGGVADIGAIPCDVFNKMIVIGPKGTRLSLLTWAAGYYNAQTGKSIDEIIGGAPDDGDAWDFFGLTDHLVNYCEENPDAVTREAVIDLGRRLTPENG